MTVNLTPGQYSIGNFVFGAGTLFNVEQFDLAGWDVNVQDFQAQKADEIRFGSDSLKPLPIQVTINAFKNRVLENVAGLVGADTSIEYLDTTSDFIKEWRSDDTRMSWGSLKPLSYCRADGSVVQIYGRPGKLAVGRLDPNKAYRKIVAEYRRSDTFAYSPHEWFFRAPKDEVMHIGRSSLAGMGDAPSWMRFLLIGPMIHPIIQLGDITIELDFELEIGDIVEISSYPWQRRVIHVNSGVSLNGKLITPYLDKLKFDIDSVIDLSWDATDTNTTIEYRNFATYSNGPVDGTGEFWVDYSGENGSAGTISINGGKVQYNDSGNKKRLATMIFKEDTVTDYQRVGFNMDGRAEDLILGVGEECTNRIIGRANALRTQYCYWDISYYAFWFGIFSDGQSYPLSPKYEIPRAKWFWQNVYQSSIFGDGDIQGIDFKYEAEFGTGAGKLWSNLYINDHLMIQYDGFNYVANLPGFNLIESLTNSTHRKSGLGFVATTRGPFGQGTPGKVKDFWVQDNPPADLAAALDYSAVYMMWRNAWHKVD